jgi:uncharacterized membrane protein YqjE
MTDTRDDRSLGELFGELSRELSTLVRKELELARVELGSKASRVGARLGMVGVAAVIACAGLYAIVAGLVLLVITFGLSAWLSAMLVGVVVLAIGGFMAQQAISGLRQLDLTPTETVRTLKENAEWAKGQTTR